MRWSPAAEPPPGLRYVPDLVTAAEEEELLAAVAALPFRAVVMRGVAAKRSVVHYGVDYGYESWMLAPAPAPPACLGPVRERAATLAGVASQDLAQVLVTRYPPGAGIGWHRDAPMFGPAVVGVSLGAPTLLRLRRRTGAGGVIYRLALAPRSAYVLEGPARTAWQHGLGPATSLRYSLTFRTLRQKP